MNAREMKSSLAAFGLKREVKPSDAALKTMEVMGLFHDHEFRFKIQRVHGGQRITTHYLGHIFTPNGDDTGIMLSCDSHSGEVIVTVGEDFDSSVMFEASTKAEEIAQYILAKS